MLLYLLFITRYYLIRDATSTAVSANGASLDVTGKVILTVTLGPLNVIQEFTVVHHLTMDCLLGADFLKNTILYIVDCGNIMFYLTNKRILCSSILTWDTLTPTTNPSYQQFYYRISNEHNHSLVYSAVIMEKLSLTCGSVASVLVKTPNSHMSDLLLKPIDQWCFVSDEY